VADATQQQAVQKQLEAADINQNATARIQQYNDAEQKITNDVGWIPIYQNKILLMQSTKLKGVAFNALSITPPDDWSKIYISQ
jgi:peptide/nickel transport system substrate-binding protein/oligopeptide transport system substrate-binding protein